MQVDDRQYASERREHGKTRWEGHSDEKMFYVSGASLCYAFAGFILLVLIIILTVLVGRTNELLRHLLLHKLSKAQRR